MHAVWGVPELAEMILEHLPKNDIRRVLRCSRRDFQLASPLAWWDIETHDLRQLLETLPFEENEDYAHTRLGQYRALVRTLRVNFWLIQTSGTGFRNRNRLSALLSNPSIAPLFPSLRRLEVDVPRSPQEFKILTLLIQPTLQSLKLGEVSLMDFLFRRLGPPPPSYSAVWSSANLLALSKALSTAKGLVHLSLEVNGAYRGRAELLQQMFCPPFDKLTRIHFVFFRSHRASLSALIALPSLKKLEVDQRDRNMLSLEDVQDLPYFPCLTTFQCEDVPHRKHVGLVLLSRMKTLRNVTISASVFEEKHHHMIPLDVRQLAVLIVQSNHTLRDIRIKIEREDKYTFSDFAPLYECGGLRHLELGIGGEFEDIEDVHFQQMAQSWPDLHFLAIVTEIWRDDYSVDLDQIDPAELTSVSLDVLQFFLHHCPKLNNLRLTCIGAPHTSYPTVPIQVDSGHGPLCLDLGGLSEEVAESAAVARFLYALYQDREIRFLGKTAYAKDVQKVLDHQRESQRDLQGDSIDDVPESG